MHILPNNEPEPVSFVASFHVLSQHLICLHTADLWNLLLFWDMSVRFCEALYISVTSQKVFVVCHNSLKRRKKKSKKMGVEIAHWRTRIVPRFFFLFFKFFLLLVDHIAYTLSVMGTVNVQSNWRHCTSNRSETANIYFHKWDGSKSWPVVQQPSALSLS